MNVGQGDGTRGVACAGPGTTRLVAWRAPGGTQQWQRALDVPGGAVVMAWVRVRLCAGRCPVATGCGVVAMLKAGGMILREGTLERTPPIFRSTYCNEVRGSRAEDGIRVRGREPAGSCSGLLDTLTGGALPKVADTVPGIRIHAGRRRAARRLGNSRLRAVPAEPSRCSVLVGCASVPVCDPATPRLGQADISTPW